MSEMIHLEITKDGRLIPATRRTPAPVDECWPDGMFPFRFRYDMGWD